VDDLVFKFNLFLHSDLVENLLINLSEKSPDRYCDPTLQSILFGKKSPKEKFWSQFQFCIFCVLDCVCYNILSIFVLSIVRQSCYSQGAGDAGCAICRCRVGDCVRNGICHKLHEHSGTRRQGHLTLAYLFLNFLTYWTCSYLFTYLCA